MDNLKELRQARGLSQHELAEMVGCSQGMISKIEQGRANPTLELILQISAALKTGPASLFGLPELQQRAVSAFEKLEPQLQHSALQILEQMARK